MAGDLKQKSFENLGAIIENVRDHLLVEFFVPICYFCTHSETCVSVESHFIIGHPMFFRLLRCWMDGWMDDPEKRMDRSGSKRKLLLLPEKIK
jgi:hypothetical protein